MRIVLLALVLMGICSCRSEDSKTLCQSKAEAFKESGGSQVFIGEGKNTYTCFGMFWYPVPGGRIYYSTTNFDGSYGYTTSEAMVFVPNPKGPQ